MKRLTRGLALAGTIPLLVAVALTVLDILLRSVSMLTVHGLTDIVTLCTMIGAMLALPYCYSHDQNVVIDVFTSRLPGRVERWLEVAAALLGFCFLAGVFWFSVKQMITEWGYGDRSQSIGIPMIWYWLPLVAGIGIAALVNLWVVWRLVAGTAGRERS